MKPEWMKKCPSKYRRSCVGIKYYPLPKELYIEVMKYESRNTLRDRALVATLYLLALRISEALRLRKSQFYRVEGKDYIIVRAIELSKRHKKDKPREVLFRKEG